MSWLIVQHLAKSFLGPAREKIHAVVDVSFTVERGELMALVGPSGCGKTTTLRLIAGLESPDQGTIVLNGQRMDVVAPKDRDIAMVFQSPALYPHLTAYQNMAFGLKLRKVPRLEIEKRVAEAGQMLGLTACLARRPQELSGGQRQRVALGRAIVRQPKLFLLDEPLSNLDGPMRTQLRIELAELQRRLGVAMIYVTHDQNEAMILGNRIAIMNEGTIQQIADPATLRKQPANEFVARFLA